DRVAGILQVNEVDSLDDAAILHVEARDDADLQAHSRDARWQAWGGTRYTSGSIPARAVGAGSTCGRSAERGGKQIIRACQLRQVCPHATDGSFPLTICGQRMSWVKAHVSLPRKAAIRISRVSPPRGPSSCGREFLCSFSER